MPKRWLTQSVGGGGRGTEEAKIKKGHRKQGQKPHRIALRRVGGACPFAAFSILPLRLQDRHRAAPVPQIQTNSSGSYRRSNKCRTFTFSSEGSATVSPPSASPITGHPHSCLHCNPRAFRRCLFSSSSPVPSSLSHSRPRIAPGNEGARVCNFIMYDGFPRTVHS